MLMDIAKYRSWLKGWSKCEGIELESLKIKVDIRVGDPKLYPGDIRSKS